MKNWTITCKLLTPCFCAGADQAKAEVRAPSIRGELRSWFRMLGGTADMERDIFGGIHGQCTASALVVRTRTLEAFSDLKQLPSQNAMHPLGYLYHFARVSSDGQRYRAGAFIGPGSRFEVRVHLKRALAPQGMALLERTLFAFSQLGSLGLRATRGMGAWEAEGECLSLKQLESWLISEPAITSRILSHKPAAPEHWASVQTALGEFLKDFRKRNRLSGKHQTAVGCAGPRLKSGLRLRPVSTKEGIVPLVYYTDAGIPAGVRSVAHLIT